MTELRLVARVAPTDAPLRVLHYLGMPSKLTGGSSSCQLLPWPQIVLIESWPEGVVLVRFADAGQYAGETWHPNVEQALQQAAFEYAELLGAWSEIPPEVDDVVGWSLNHAP